jgi:pimeloyl-ACP methyl ester carboxylesterase
MKKILLYLFLSLSAFHAISQSVPYPYPVKYLQLEMEKQKFRMAYMDVMPAQSNGQTVLLLHGKNFNGYYWKDVISFLKDQGYRVIVPDQAGFGLSDKPNNHYSFHLLAANTKTLLDSLGITKVHLVGHSMGGMLAARFALLYPATVEKLVFENPIGLEDYRLFVPYRSVDEQFAVELKATYESYKKYQQSYYPVWKAEYEPLVVAQYTSMKIPGVEQAAWASALTYNMIYQEPVVYEFKNLIQKTLIII